MKSLPEMHDRVTHTETQSTGTVKQRQGEVCPRHDPAKSLWLQSARHEGEGMPRPWHISVILSCHWGLRKLGKHGGLQVVL